MKTSVFKTTGTCSKEIRIATDNGVIQNVEFVGGCPGNLSGISQLVRGMRPEEVISRLEGVRCGLKSTSCPDQLAKALKEML